jgi:hypothetical protein
LEIVIYGFVFAVQTAGALPIPPMLSVGTIQSPASWLGMDISLCSKKSSIATHKKAALGLRKGQGSPFGGT